MLGQTCCTKVNITFLPDLCIGDKKSPRLIFRVDVANESTLAQYTAEKPAMNQIIQKSQ